MARLGRLSQLALGAAQRSLLGAACEAGVRGAPAYVGAISSLQTLSTSQSWYHTSRSAWDAAVPAQAQPGSVAKQDEKLAHLVDKDVWDEAWAYEPRFGTEDRPIEVPALLAERIIGVTDPEDDTLVIWGIIRAGEPPKQLVAGGEFFVLKKVEKIDRVGDMLGASPE